MTTTHNQHASTAAAPPQATPDMPLYLWARHEAPAVHADADLSDADWGAINRELLAEKLASAYHPGVDVRAMFADPRSAGIRADWLDVADVAIAELQVP